MITKLKKFSRRGQVVMFYALLFPILLLCCGVGLDLGWYYLNVSRLQNAADASVLVGAKTLTEAHDLFKDKSYKAKLIDKYPANSPAKDDKDNLILTPDGDMAALNYAKKNLAENPLGYAPPNFFSVAQAADDNSIKDGYTRGHNTVTMTTGLYQNGEDYYYVVGLSEDIRHFFIGFLDDMNAGVVAVALISKKDSGGVDDPPENPPDDPPTPPIPEPKELTIILDANGGTLKDENGTDGRNTRNVTVSPKTDNSGYEDTTLPTETAINLKKEGYKFTGWKDDNGNFYPNGKTFTDEEIKDLFGNESEVTLYAQWEKEVTPTEIPGIEGNFIRLRNDINKNYKSEYIFLEGNILNEDSTVSFVRDVKNNSGRLKNPPEEPREWDPYLSGTNISVEERLTRDPNESSFGQVPITPELDKNSSAGTLRIHAEIFVNSKASGAKDDTPRYIHIAPEYSNLDEDIKYTSVRQIVINVDVSNWDDGRPIIFVYDTPPMISKPASNLYLEAEGLNKKIRDPFPVILNLNTNFRGGVYSPNTPVVVRAHDHKFEGFVVAKDLWDFKPLQNTKGNPATHEQEKNRKELKANQQMTRYMSIKNNYRPGIYTGAYEQYNYPDTPNKSEKWFETNAPISTDGNVLYRSEPVNINEVQSRYDIGAMNYNNFGASTISGYTMPQASSTPFILTK